ncbi:hypothetical protein BJ878DRAFT_526633 [Calycina marina]|uniref:Uncharacterized protein n=1 Tax=Calycina marina TaxID=1763456 RepID=A0A9P8CAW1_9HELO|nr:hypothetical protein BJ878DRAFT_526633 [Calycina marina]
MKAKIAATRFESSLDYNSSSADVERSFGTLFDTLLSAPTNNDLNHHLFSREFLLNEVLCSLESLRDSITGLPALLDAIDSLVTLHNAQSEIQDNSHLQPESLKPLKLMLFRLPIQFIPIINTHPAIMLFMAHLHVVVLFIQPLADQNHAGFYSLNVAPIQAFYEEITLRVDIERRTGETSSRYEDALMLIEFHLTAIRAFQWMLNHLPHRQNESNSSRVNWIHFPQLNVCSCCKH